MTSKGLIFLVLFFFLTDFSSFRFPPSKNRKNNFSSGTFGRGFSTKSRFCTFSSVHPSAMPPMHGSKKARVLQACKHTDRAKNRCPEPLRVRPHKRGHLTAECTAGHQWVWCPLCCNCGKLGTNGCHQAAHWIERDCYDTGKRNHMQRHGPCQMPTNVLKAVALPEVCADWQSADCGARSVL